MSLAAGVHAEVLAHLAAVSITARQAVEALLAGQHRSIRRGLSVEFAGHRPYLPGDDLRRLDWGVWARTDRLEVRLYEEETRLRATIVVDASGSMAYGPHGSGIGGPTKLDYARTLAAAMGFLLVRASDAVGLAVVDDAVRWHLPPASTMGHLLALLERLADCPPGGETDLHTVLQRLIPALNRRGIVIIITDGLDDPEQVIMVLRELRHRRQDVRVLVIDDPDEAAFPFAGSLKVHGLEHEAPLEIDGDRVRAWYAQARANHRAALQTGCHAIGAQIAWITTDENPADALLRVLNTQAGAEADNGDANPSKRKGRA